MILIYLKESKKHLYEITITTNAVQKLKKKIPKIVFILLKDIKTD